MNKLFIFLILSKLRPVWSFKAVFITISSIISDGNICLAPTVPLDKDCNCQKVFCVYPQSFVYLIKKQTKKGRISETSARSELSFYIIGLYVIETPRKC